MIIAIDGPAATGKSTSAKLVSQKLGFTYLDTGAMYRCVTLLVLRNNVEIKNQQDHLTSLLNNFQLDIKNDGKDHLFLLDGEDVSKDIRSSDVTDDVSAVSALPVVRKRLVSIQRKIADNQDAVVEGRDIGTCLLYTSDAADE